MDGILKKFPEPLFKDASPRSAQLNFHPKTRNACSGNSSVSLKSSKAIVVGDLGVGKTSIINRYFRNQFEKDYKPTIGVEYEMKKYEILNCPFQLQIWDTSGEERFKCITAAYYRGAHAIVVTFDLTESASLFHCSQWLEEALDKTRTTVPEIFLVGNKKDACAIFNASEAFYDAVYRGVVPALELPQLLQERVKNVATNGADKKLLLKSKQLESIREEAKKISRDLNAEYWEVSAKSGENVRELFSRISAITFDQSVLKELENLDDSSPKEQIGATNDGGPTIQLGKQPLQKGSNADGSKRSCCKS